MSFFRKQRILLLGVGLIVLTNAVALAGVAYNRSGSPESVLLLSQRELNYYRGGQEDNSGISVNFDWRVMDDHPANAKTAYFWRNYSQQASWLNNAKLKQLGFNTDKPDIANFDGTIYDRLKDREVFLVLEFNGPAYRRYLKAVKESKNLGEDKKAKLDEINRAETEDTRLFVADAGTDADSLRKLYPDRNMYVIVKGVVSAHWETFNDTLELIGYVKSLSVSTLHVSKPDDAVFNSIPANDSSGKYQVKVAYGQRHEPWILSATK